MRQVTIIAALHKAGIEQALKDLVGRLEGFGLNVILPRPAAELIGRDGFDEPIPIEGSDLVIALGGDGSVLSAARIAAPLHIPVLGIRMGGFGFLTEAERDEAPEALERVLKGDYWLEERSLLSASVYQGGQPVTVGLALNDVLVVKSVEAPLPQWEVRLDGTLLTLYPADGLLLSTPTGSTAYSLSIGGPILAPDLPGFVLCPFAPHSLTLRPLVLAEKAKVSIRLLPQRRRVVGEVCLDGQVRHDIIADDQVDVSIAPQKARIVRYRQISFYDRLRQKLRWGDRQ